jgi:hypothetical protein
LPEGKHGPESIALVELGFEHRNAGIDQAGLNMREAARPDRGIGTRQHHGIGRRRLRHLSTLLHDADGPARFVGIELRALRRDNHQIRLRDRVNDDLRRGAFEIDHDEGSFRGGVFDPFDDRVLIHIGHDG